MSLAYNPNTNLIYAGLYNGDLMSCSADQVNNCKKIDTFGDPIFSLLFDNNQIIYAGIGNGDLMSCNISATNNCDTIDDFGTDKNPVRSLALDHSTNTLYAGWTKAS